MARWYTLSAILLGLPAVVSAQDSTTVTAPVPAATLTLAEALEQAKGNSPLYRQTLNDAGPARWAVRNAYGSFLPTVSVNGGVGYTGSGQSNFGGGFIRATSPIRSSFGYANTPMKTMRPKSPASKNDSRPWS